MLSSTRATARNLTARASSSLGQIPPAESSRQALLRAIAQQRHRQHAAESEQRRTIHHRRRNGSTYSTAVAYADDDKGDRMEHAGLRQWTSHDVEAEHMGYRQPQPPDRAVNLDDSFVEDDRPPSDQYAVNTIEDPSEATAISLSTLVDWIESDPIQALHRLPQFPPEQLSQLTSRQLTDLLKNIYKTSRGQDPTTNARYRNSERALAVLRNLLHGLPSSPRSDDHGLGKRFRRDLLSRFLRACAIFDCDDLLRDTVKDRLISQKLSGEILLQPDMLATELTVRRRWDLIIDLFSPARFPITSYTPFTVQRLMQAHLGSGRAYKVPSIFDLYTELGLQPPPKSYSLLVQAHLMSGDIDNARQVMRDIAESGTVDGVEQQLAILRGHKGLGRDQDMERKALELAEGLEDQPKIAIIHAIIRLRLDCGDHDGAQLLLDRFRFDSAESASDQNRLDLLSPDEQTYRLAFRAYSPLMTLEELQIAWQDIVVRTPSLTDGDVVVLCEALVRLDRLDLATSLISGSVAEHKTAFPIPKGFRPGVLAHNALLRSSCNKDGLKGLERAIKVFSTVGIEPHARTLGIIIDFVRTTTTSDPVQLANMLNAFLREFPALKPSVDHINVLLSQAVRARSRDALKTFRQNAPASFEALEEPAEVGSLNAQAGLKASDPFKKAMRGIIQSLQARGVRSVSRSLATRLRFDAHSGGTVPAVQTVWDDMLARGFRPDKRHLLALMKGYAESGHMRECEDIILLAKETGVEVTRGMWMVIMTGYGRKETFNLPRAEKAFHTMRRSEQGLDPAAVCAMIGIYLRAKRRHLASHLALQLVGNLVPDGDPRNPITITRTQASSTRSLPSFPTNMLDERVIAIATDALRLDHPQCALEVISAKHPSSIPTRVRQVVKSIRSRARSRTKWNIANSLDQEVLAQAEKMLEIDAQSPMSSNIAHTGGSGRRRIGPKGMKKRILRFFERRRHRARGGGGRKVISAREERKQRHEAISNAVQTLS